MERITTIDDVSQLYITQHINLCVGCEFERTASCDDDRVPTCNKQLKLKANF